MFRTYDDWKTTNPADEFLGDPPDDDVPPSERPTVPRMPWALAQDVCVNPNVADDEEIPF